MRGLGLQLFPDRGDSTRRMKAFRITSSGVNVGPDVAVSAPLGDPRRRSLT